MHVVILGCGPAGCFFAEALAQTAQVTVAGPDSQWQPTYGAWVDELPPSVVYDATWPRADVKLSSTQRFVIERTYGRLDNEATRTALLSAATEAGGTLLRDHAEITDAGLIRLRDADEVLEAELVIDARGASAGGKATMWQQAFGIAIDAPAGWENRFTFMDFESAVGAPQFLYAMGAGGRLFVEETVLVGRGLRDWEALATDLQTRLRRLGIPQTEIVSQERCVIPMDLPLRLGAGRVIPVGAAAGWVHPAAGYSIAMAARKAKRLAELISSGIRDAAQLRAQLWTDEERAADALYRFGGQVLADLDLTAVRAFFGAFFGQGGDVDAFLSRTLGIADLRRLMWHTYRAANPAVRTRLRGAVWHHPHLFMQGFPGVMGAVDKLRPRSRT